MVYLLGTLLYVSLLLINSVAILSEERFLARVGWSSSSQYSQFGNAGGYGGDAYGQPGGDGPGVKTRLIHLISAMRTVMRIPLIAVNALVIGYEIVLG